MLTFRETTNTVFQALKTNAEYLQVPADSIQKGTLFDTPASAPFIILFAELSDKFEAVLDNGELIEPMLFTVGCAGSPASSQPDTHANTVELSERIRKIVFGTLGDSVMDFKTREDAIFLDSTSIIIDFVTHYKPSV